MTSSSSWCCSDSECLDVRTWGGLKCHKCGKDCIGCPHYENALWNKRRYELKKGIFKLAWMCTLFGCNDTCPIYLFCEGRFKKQVYDIVEELR